MVARHAIDSKDNRHLRKETLDAMLREPGCRVEDESVVACNQCARRESVRPSAGARSCLVAIDPCAGFE